MALEVRHGCWLARSTKNLAPYEIPTTELFAFDLRSHAYPGQMSD
jgi:hypothetical protein